MDMSIVIISMNQERYLRPCLSALRAGLGGLQAQVLLVDNASEDGTGATAHAAYPGIQVIREHARRSFARCNNIAAEQAKGRYVVFLNADTEVRPDSLALLARYLDARPSVGVAAPKLVGPAGVLQHSCRAFPTARAVFFRWLPACPQTIRLWACRDYLMLDWDHAEARPIGWAFGACLCARRSAIEQVGLLDEGFRPLYCEDIDWCYRMWRAGWEVHYVPQAVVMHHHQRTSAKCVFSRTTWFHLRGMARFFVKRGLGPSYPR